MASKWREFKFDMDTALLLDKGTALSVEIYSQDHESFNDTDFTDYFVEHQAYLDACELIRELAGAFEKIYKMHEYECEEELYGCRCVTVSLAKPALQKIKQWRGEE